MAPLITGFDLPRFVKIKGALNSVLGQKEDGSLWSFPKDEFIPFPNFKVQMAKSGNGQFSIKSCYSNKYMVLEGPDSILLTMGAAEPNEDPSQWSCTLFEVVDIQKQLPQEALSNPDGPVIQLRFVHSQKLVCKCLPSDGSADNFQLGVDRNEKSKVAYCIVPDYFTFVESKEAMNFPVSSLPRFVTLVVNNHYVGHDKDGSLKLYDANAPVTATVNNQFELEHAKTGEGLVNIKSHTSNKYWVLADQHSVFLKAGADKPNEDQSHWSCTLFQPVDYQPLNDGTYLAFRLVHSNEEVVCHHQPSVNDGTSLVGVSNDKLNRRHSLPLFVQAVDCGAGPVLPKHPYDSFRYVVLRSNYNNKFMHQTNKVDNGFPDGSIRGDGEDALKPNCKFELERPNAADHKGLCHIRSCYNIKYLTMEDGIIKAVATKPNPKPNKSAEVEDKDGYHTLFELVHVGDQDRIQLRFVHSQGLVAYSRFTKSFFQPLEDEGVALITTELSVFDWEKFVSLPTHVAFKGNNGKYLAARTIGYKHYLRFDADDIRDKEAAHEISYSPDGLCVRIMSSHTGKFWHIKDGRVQADALSGDKDTLFLPIKTGRNTVALRCESNKLFCKRLDTGDVTDSLSANVDSIDRFACITVEERVYKRMIRNINFRIADARIYDETIKTMVIREASNHNSENETVQLRILYQQKNSHTFNGGFSLSASYEEEIKCSPPMVEAGAKFTVGIESSFGWGETTETSSDIETTHVVTVPAYSTVQVLVVGTEGKCDIPFSYTVHDTLMSGTVKTYEVDGGIYTSVSNYNFHYDTHKLPLKAQGTTLENQSSKI